MNNDTSTTVKRAGFRNRNWEILLLSKQNEKVERKINYTCSAICTKTCLLDLVGAKTNKSIYTYKTEAFKTPTIFHVSTILKKKKKKNIIKHF